MRQRTEDREQKAEDRRQRIVGRRIRFGKADIGKGQNPWSKAIDSLKISLLNSMRFALRSMPDRSEFKFLSSDI